MSFKQGGILVAGSLIGCNIALSLVRSAIPNDTLYPVATAVVVSGFLLDQLFFTENKYHKIFRLCGLENKDKKIPIVIKEQKTVDKTTLVIHLPEGLSQRHFEQKQMELEQYFNAKIKFGFNKNLIMEMVKMNLSTMYPYTFEQTEKPLEVFCGYTNEGKFLLDIEKTPHMIIAGETGSGKTSLLDVIILSLLRSQHDVDLHLIDFQAVGLGKYEMCKKVRSYGETPEDFEKLLDEMEEENAKRIKLFRSVKNRVHIDKLETWNKLYPDRALKYKVVIIDEFARLSDEQYKPLLERFRTRVSMDRKAGIHYIVAMQRPDVKCIEGSIKANMPTRVAFKTVTETDSKVILDIEGAEKLTNPGRFIIKYCGELQEVQAMYMPSEEIRKYLRKHKLYKTRKEIEEEKAEYMRKLREKCINPYLKGWSNDNQARPGYNQFP